MGSSAYLPQRSSSVLAMTPGGFRDGDAAFRENPLLGLRGVFLAADDGTGVAHAAARRRGGSGDESGDRLLAVVLRPAAASSSALPPISPIMMMASVSGSSLNILSTSRCEVPLIGSPPMPTQVLWP